MTHTGTGQDNDYVNLIIDASLSSPPSDPTSFRDITLHACIHNYENVLALAPKGMRSKYWDWMKRNGVKDYVDEILTPYEALGEKGIWIHEENDVRWFDVHFITNGILVKALHPYIVPHLVEYVRFVNDD